MSVTLAFDCLLQILEKFRDKYRVISKFGISLFFGIGSFQMGRITNFLHYFGFIIGTYHCIRNKICEPFYSTVTKIFTYKKRKFRKYIYHLR